MFHVEYYARNCPHASTPGSTNRVGGTPASGDLPPVTTWANPPRPGVPVAVTGARQAGRGSDVAFEDAGLGQAGQALADGAGAVLADALDRLQVVDACREQLL